MAMTGTIRATRYCGGGTAPAMERIDSFDHVRAARRKFEHQGDPELEASSAAPLSSSPSLRERAPAAASEPSEP